MARRRRRTETRRSEETPDFSSPERLLRTIKPPSVKLSPVVETIVRHTSPTALREIEDRRTYHPQGPKRPARSVDKPLHRLVITKGPEHPAPSKRSQATLSALPKGVSFHAPKKVLVCVRRQARKEVLFALSKTGKGARARRRRHSYYSKIGC